MSELNHTRRSFRVLAVVLLALGLFAGVTWAQGEAADEPPDPEQFMNVHEPPDGKWLKDENGAEYFLWKWPKYEGDFRWIDEEKGLIKVGHFPVLEVDKHDDDFLYFRYYRAVAPPSIGPTEADFAAVAETYRTEIATQDRWRLEPFAEDLPKRGQWRQNFELADMNGDGHLDLVHGPPRKSGGQPIIALGDGKGGFRNWPELELPTLPYDYGMVKVADVNADGHQDIVLGAHLTGILVLVGDGEGSFESWGEGLPLRRSAVKRQRKILEQARAAPGRAAPTASAARNEEEDEAASEDEVPMQPPSFTSRAIELADWNGDGRVDILALSEGAGSIQDITDQAAGPLSKRVYLNGGDGTWSAIDGEGMMVGETVLATDLNGDGRTDFVTDSRALGSGWILNENVDGRGWKTATIPDVRDKLVIWDVALMDVEGDGDDDLLIAFQSNELKIVRQGLDLYLREGDGWNRRSVYATQEERRFMHLEPGDLDADDDLDLVALTDRGEVWLFVNDGDGDFVRELSPEADPADEHFYCAGYDAQIVDLDGDGRQDLVASFAGEPGSEQLFTPEVKLRCSARGAIKAWRLQPIAEDATADEAADR